MTDRRPKLTDEQRAFLVRELACYASPKEAADALRERYGVTVTPQTVEYYDPNKPASKKGKALAPKWADMHKAARKAFLEHVEDSVPEANKAVRIHERAKLYRRAKKSGNDVLAAQHLDGIAKETGNVYTNRHELTGRDGRPVFEDMTDEQIDKRAAVLIAKARGIANDGSNSAGGA